MSILQEELAQQRLRTETLSNQYGVEIARLIRDNEFLKSQVNSAASVPGGSRRIVNTEGLQTRFNMNGGNPDAHGSGHSERRSTHWYVSNSSSQYFHD